MLTDFPLSTPASPKRCDVKHGVRDSTGCLDTRPNTVEAEPASCEGKTSNMSTDPVEEQQQQPISSSSPNKAKTIPGRPPRPQYGLYDSSTGAHRATDLGLHSPPRVNTLAEAFQKSLNKTSLPALGHDLFTSSTAQIPPTQDARNPSATSTGQFQPSERKASAAPNPTIPFVICMGSPHNPTVNLIAPKISIGPTTCSITRYHAPMKSVAMNPKMEVGSVLVSVAMSGTCPASSAGTGRSDEEAVLSVSKLSNDVPGTPNDERKASEDGVVTAIRLPKKDAVVERDGGCGAGEESDGSLGGLGGAAEEEEENKGIGETL